MELSINGLMVLLVLEISLNRMLLMLGFSEIVLSKNESALSCLTQIPHILEFTEGHLEHLLDLLILIGIIVITTSFSQNVFKELKHLHNINISSVEFTNF